jgi:thioredoxin reductase (NADPH)
MITSAELQEIPIFACLDPNERKRYAERAADVRLENEEWLIQEGQTPYFGVLLDGSLELLKDQQARAPRQITKYKRGEFFGEVPILLGAQAFASVRSVGNSRVARFEPQHLMELIQTSPECSAIILQTMTNRLMNVQNFAKDAPGSRVHMIGKQYDEECRDIRTFLSANRIPYEWVDREKEPERVPRCVAATGTDATTVVIDGMHCVETPVTVRKVARDLGIRTTPRLDSYDVVIAGAGPAGLAAGVYGATEGLSVLMVEKSAAGGQAGTSSRIENYLGFPSGISGDELSERALKQAVRFNAEIAMTRTIKSIEPLSDGRYCVQLDNDDGEGGERVSACVVVLATGVEWERLRGRGVLYGASRDEASNVVGKHVFLVGGGNSAGQAAMFFSNYAAEVTVLVRGKGLELTMSQYLIEQIAKKANIHVEPYTQVVRAEGEDHLERIVTRTAVPGTTASEQTRDAQALFVMIGADASTDWLPAGVQRDAKGYICTGRDLSSWPLEREPFPLETSLPGIFCAGDVRHDSIKRVSSGVGEGSMAIAFVHQYLALKNF